MPELDGLELARQIRLSPLNLDVKIIAMCAIGDSVDDPTIHALDLVGVLAKPVRQSDLHQTIVSALNVEPPTPWQPARQKDAPSSKIKQPPDALRILLAEDNEINQLVAGEVLSHGGYWYEVASNGRQAVNAVQRTGYDLVLMDCQMPEMDGFEATQEIRRLEDEGMLASKASGRLPIIALTANAVKGDRERCLTAGMDEYLTKPLDPKQLLATIHRLLKGQSNSQKAAATDAHHGDDVTTNDHLTPAEPAAPGQADSPSGGPFEINELLDRCLGNIEIIHRLLDKFVSSRSNTLKI